MGTHYSGVVSCAKAIEFMTELGMEHMEAETILRDAVSCCSGGGFYVGQKEYEVDWLFDGGMGYEGYTGHPIELYLFTIGEV